VSRFRFPKGLRLMCVLAAVAASVTGCVGMPSGGPAGEGAASAASQTPDVNFIGPFPAGPQPGGSPQQIVQGFLLASASYPTYPQVAPQYLVSSAGKTWQPGWAVTVYSKLTVPPAQVSKASKKSPQQATVNVSGAVQASFDGSGQYVSALSQGQTAGSYTFNLVKVGGQWRITDPPDFRMLPVSDFPLFYKAQDLYFFDPQDQLLVPDSVFVPLGVTASQLLENLVAALTADPKTLWLAGAADSEFTQLPTGTKVQSIVAQGSTVTVNLKGHVPRADAKYLELFAAQLAWTLTSSTDSVPNIQSVVLEVNGQPWAPDNPPCEADRSPGIYQTRAAYGCFNPYQSSPASFDYTSGGQAWARCGTESQASLDGLIGSVVPVVTRTGGYSSQQCSTSSSQYVREDSAASPPAQPSSLPAASMVAVSPDGEYLAIVSPDKNAVYIGKLSGDAVSFSRRARLTEPDITSLSWDHGDDLWVAQGGNVWMLQAAGGSPVSVDVDGQVSDLAVAPDGVRIAYIAQIGDLAPGIYLAAIGGGQSTGQLGAPTAHLSIRDAASIGPGLDDPVSLAWYDADDLIVLNDAAGGTTLSEVPVDGQQAQQQAPAPPDATSITADGSENVLVAGLSGDDLAVSTSMQGPWDQLGNQGQDPAYPG
jgi:Lipoprotein LpqB beta-propeller domain/Sporulation and spore germination